MKQVKLQISRFVGFIGHGLGNKFANQRDLKHLEVVELYKQRIVDLECELIEAINERNEFKNHLFKQIGLIEDKKSNPEDYQSMSRNPMSPGRMRNVLEIKSRQSKDKK